MLMTDSYGLVPGITTSRETYEQEFRWGPGGQGMFANGLIDGASTDSGNTPTYELRPGLLLGQVYATGKYKPYSPTASDGTEVASAVLIEALRMQDFTGASVDRFYEVLVGGPVQAAKILGLDLQARQQMDKFVFDDSLNVGSIPGNHWFPWKRFQTKTTNYTIVASDNFTLFDNTGAGGEVDLTLPTIANGYLFGARCQAAQVLKFISNEGGNVIGTTATQTSVSITAIGGVVVVYTNAAGTKWIVEQRGTQTITAA
jgi:hypothetical protein